MTAPENPPSSSDEKMTPMRRMMWGAAGLHVTSGLAATVTYMAGGLYSDGFRGLFVLSIVSGCWVIWSKNEDQQDRQAQTDAWLFQTNSQKQKTDGPRPMSDFRDDTRSSRA